MLICSTAEWLSVASRHDGPLLEMVQSREQHGYANSLQCKERVQ